MSVLNVKGVGSPMKTNLQWTDHIWAKNGVVYWRSKEGGEGHLDPDEALSLADRINRDFINIERKSDRNLTNRRRMRDEMVEKLVNATRAAMRQREQPRNEAERLLSCAFNGVNRKGEKITSGKVFNEQSLDHYCETYPYLSKDDVVAILKSNKISPAEASRLLEMENRKRAIEHKDPDAAATIPI